MHGHPSVSLTRDCDAVVIPVGTPVKLQKGEEAHITQTLGGSYTVVVNGNMFRIEGKDADALGFDPAPVATVAKGGAPKSPEELEKQVWNQMRSCYDPEIPVNIVDLGLVYDCHLSLMPAGGGTRADVKLTLTAPGCGMGDFLRQDVLARLGLTRT